MRNQKEYADIVFPTGAVLRLSIYFWQSDASVIKQAFANWPDWLRPDPSMCKVKRYSEIRRLA